MNTPIHTITTQLPTSRLALRQREAAKALGISLRTLGELTADHSSGIPHMRIGRAVLYPVTGLDRWLAKKAQEEGGRQ